MHRPQVRSVTFAHAAWTLGAIAALLCPSPAAAAPLYTLQVLGTLRTDGTGSSYAGGINASGVVVGGASAATGTALFRWRPGSGMSDHGMLVPPNPSYGLSVNSSEAVCGYALTQSGGFAGAFRENPAGPIRELPRIPGGADAYAYAISDSGVSVGWSNAGSGCGAPTCAGNPGRAVAWDSATVRTTMPDLGGVFSAGTGISRDGSKLCGYGADPSGQVRAFRVVGGVATALPPLAGYDESQAYGVNDAGQVVGYSALGATRRATLWNANTPVDLGTTPGSLGSVAVKINDAGTIVGYVILAGPVDRAAVFAPGSSPTDLNLALQNSSPYTLLYCNDVNAGGRIVGQADSAGTARGFVLTPLGASGVEAGRRDAGSVLSAPWPNPGSAGTRIRFSLAAAGRARLEVLDLGGRMVALPVDAWLAAGDHALEWDGRNVRGRRVPPGVYFVRLASGRGEVTRKLVVDR